MSEPENFLSRWSRLKRESGIEENRDEQQAGPVPDAGAPVPDAGTPFAPAFDPASLPPIESIVADSDIRPFLAAGVPPELARVALRSAWAADPAIRDFVGIAESQWDFNDPAAIPGFGPLGPAEYAQALATRVLASLDSAALPLSSTPADDVRQVAARPEDSSHNAGSDGHAAEITNAPEASPTPARHAHGSALPR
jgi:hypothetical protein